MAAIGGMSFEIYAPGAPRVVLDKTIQEIAEGMQRDIINATPRRTGRLAAGWKLSRHPRYKRASFYVTNDVPYARFVEYGTRRRPAAAMSGRVLATYRRRYGGRTL